MFIVVNTFFQMVINKNNNGIYNGQDNLLCDISEEFIAH